MRRRGLIALAFIVPLAIAGGLAMGLRHTAAVVHGFCDGVKPNEPFEHVHARANGLGLEAIEGPEIVGEHLTLFQRRFPGIVANCQVRYGLRGVVGARYWAD